MTDPVDILTDAEIGAFQDSVRNILMEAVGAQGFRIDGGGCDSGYWPDFTLSEVGQGAAMLVEQREELLEALAAAVTFMEATFAKPSDYAAYQAAHALVVRMTRETRLTTTPPARKET